MADISDIFENRKPLNGIDNPMLKSCIGIKVGFPHYREGAQGNVCEIESEYLSLKTSSCVSWPLVGEINDKAVKMHDATIEKLEKAISELQAHKSRLVANRQALESKDVDLDQLAKERLATENAQDKG